MSIRIERNSYVPHTEGLTRPNGSASPKGGEPVQKFDQVLLSAQAAEDNPVRSLTGQVVQQLHTRPTQQDLQQLRRDILSGAYRPSAEEIAARMLLLPEGE